MIKATQEEILVIVRSLAMYASDQASNGADNSVACRLIHEYSHLLDEPNDSDSK